MHCAICNEQPPEFGVLCEDCRAELAPTHRLALEQIEVPRQPLEISGTLIDWWGRLHFCGARTLIGRHLESADLLVRDASVSRHHAHLSYDAATATWTLRDLGSTNGTMVNDLAIQGPIAIAASDRIKIGAVSFFFLPALPALTSSQPALSITLQPSNALTEATVLTTATVEDRRRRSLEPEDANEFSEPLTTGVGTPELAIAFAEPTGGGGGLVTIAGRQIQLSTAQFELMQLLVTRMAEEATKDHSIRGFIRTSELMVVLSFETTSPNEQQVKQIVRRMRRMFCREGVGNLIEARPRFGYRLAVVPK